MESPAGENRVAWLVLGVAIAISATWLMLAGHGLSFASDDLVYYAHYVTQNGEHVPTHGLEYFFAPSNGHLQDFGKLIYEVLLKVFGGDSYWAFQAVNLLGVMTCVVLFFLFARKRIGPIPALVPCVSLLFLAYGWEAFLWAFDMHTIYALAFGLGALLLFERNDRRGDVGACVLLVLSVGMIEVGLAFVFALAVAVALHRDRFRRAWVFLVPLVLYAIWWKWSRQLDQSSIELSNIRLLPKTETDALAAIAGSVFGLNPTGPGVTQSVTEITAWESVIAGIAVVALAFRISRGKVPPELWAFAAAPFAYWARLRARGRPPGDRKRRRRLHRPDLRRLPAGRRRLRPDRVLARGGRRTEPGTAEGRRHASVGLRRFADPGAPSYELVRVGKGGWVEIAIPTDAAETPWQLVVDGPVRVCPR